MSPRAGRDTNSTAQVRPQRIDQRRALRKNRCDQTLHGSPSARGRPSELKSILRALAAGGGAQAAGRARRTVCLGCCCVCARVCVACDPVGPRVRLDGLPGRWPSALQRPPPVQRAAHTLRGRLPCRRSRSTKIGPPEPPPSPDGPAHALRGRCLCQRPSPPKVLHCHPCASCTIAAAQSLGPRALWRVCSHPLIGCAPQESLRIFIGGHIRSDAPRPSECLLRQNLQYTSLAQGGIL